jgi:hypothetical protein
LPQNDGDRQLERLELGRGPGPSVGGDVLLLPQIAADRDQIDPPVAGELEAAFERGP